MNTDQIKFDFMLTFQKFLTVQFISVPSCTTCSDFMTQSSFVRSPTCPHPPCTPFQVNVLAPVEYFVLQVHCHANCFRKFLAYVFIVLMMPLPDILCLRSSPSPLTLRADSTLLTTTPSLTASLVRLQPLGEPNVV